MLLSGIGILNSSNPSNIPLDPDALAFIIAAGITNPTQISAIDNLVIDLKFFNVWNKLTVAYPFVGGTATPHSYNLINPAANQLLFSGGWSHSSTGALPNGTNAFANTGIGPLSFPQNDLHFSYYSRTNTATTGQRDIGAQQFGVFLSFSMMAIKDGGELFASFVNSNGVAYPTSSNTNSQGFYVSQRISSSSVNGFKNGIQAHTTNLSNSVSRANRTFYIGALHFNTSGFGFSSKEVAFSSIGTQLNATEQADYYTSVQTYQTALSRQI